MWLYGTDALNFVENVHHFWQAYGGWTFALEDYYVLNFTRQLDNPNTALVPALPVLTL
jgi:PhoPQ-activated pathogenicity-related protein